MFAVGIHLRPDSSLTIVTDVRSGAIAAQHMDESVASIEIEANRIVGVGLAPAPGRTGPVDADGLRTRLGVHPQTPVVEARSDLHACVPGCGIASPSTMLLVLNDDVHLLMNSRVQREVPGIAAAEVDAILPDYFGYLSNQPGLLKSEMNLPDLESAGFTIRRIVETMQAAGVPVRRFVATGTHSKNPRLLQIFADVLNERITVPSTSEPAAVGAAILACLAAGPAVTGHAHASLAIHAMTASNVETIFRPDLASRRKYDAVYAALRSK